MPYEKQILHTLRMIKLRHAFKRRGLEKYILTAETVIKPDRNTRKKKILAWDMAWLRF